MPQRDVSHGATSNEANRLFGGDMAWLAEAIAARGGTAPFASVHALYASELRDVYDGLAALPWHFVAHDLAPATNWSVGSYQWTLSDIGATPAQQQRPCRSTVVSGSPLYGYDLRVAFWNSMQCERALFNGPFQDIASSNMTYRTIGQGGITPGSNYVRLTNYKSGADGDGFEATGGTFTIPFSSSGAGFPANVDEWECDQAYAVVCVTSFEKVVSDAYCVWAAVPVDAVSDSEGVSVDALDVLAAGQGVAAHWGVPTSGWPLNGIELCGLVPIMRVAQNYRIGDLGWRFAP